MAPLSRICLIGAESTGKSELAESLAKELSAALVPEFAREYALRVARPLDFSDVAPIARGQIANEDRVTSRARGLVLLDTDLVSTVVYSVYYWQTCPDWIVRDAQARLAGLYLWLDIDVPWVEDPARDAAADRQGVHALFGETLEKFGARYERISGDWDHRRKTALAAIRAATLIP